MDRSATNPRDLSRPGPGDTCQTRRSFLRGLIAAGISPILADPAARVMDMDKERILGAQLLRDPLHFLVDEYGTLELANWMPAADRFAAYGVEPAEIDRSHDGFADLLARIEALQGTVWWHINNLDARTKATSLGRRKLDEDRDAETLAKAVDRLPPEHWSLLRSELLDWFRGEVSLEERDRADIVRPVDGRQWACQIFSRTLLGILDAQWLATAFDVTIVEGEHPGSTYYAAELGVSVEEANRIAVRLDLPIRFEATDA